MFSDSASKGKGMVERFVATGGSTPLGYLFCEKPKYARAPATGRASHHPEWNAQAADLYLPSKEDPQQMHYRHDEKQHGGDRHIGFSVQSACLSASQPITLDSSAIQSMSVWLASHKSERPPMVDLEFLIERDPRLPAAGNPSHLHRVGHLIAATREGPKVCRLPAGGRWIRTIGLATETLPSGGAMWFPADGSTSLERH
jgi:hypothetical protein